MIELKKPYKLKQIYKDNQGKVYKGKEVINLLNSSDIKIIRKNQEITGVEICLISASLLKKKTLFDKGSVHNYLNKLSIKNKFPTNQEEIKSLFKINQRLEELDGCDIIKKDPDLFYLMKFLLIPVPRKNRILPIRKPQYKWTKKKIRDIAKNYSKKSDFRKDYAGAYEVARLSGWFDFIFAHLKKKIYSEEELATEAFKYLFKSDFEDNSPDHFEQAKKQKILKKITSHMVQKSKWASISDIKKEALKYEKRSDFLNNARGAYLAAKRRGVFYEVCSHMRESKMKERNSNIEKIIAIAKSYKSYEDVCRDKKIYYILYRRGILPEIRAFFASNIESKKNNLDKCQTPEKTKQYILLFAEKCGSRKEFTAKGYRYIARSKNCLEEVDDILDRRFPISYV